MRVMFWLNTSFSLSLFWKMTFLLNRSSKIGVPLTLMGLLVCVFNSFIRLVILAMFSMLFISFSVKSTTRPCRIGLLYRLDLLEMFDGALMVDFPDSFGSLKVVALLRVDNARTDRMLSTNQETFPSSKFV